jgi:hypothetical protein
VLGAASETSVTKTGAQLLLVTENGKKHEIKKGRQSKRSIFNSASLIFNSP